jgi:hypothetical protein
LISLAFINVENTLFLVTTPFFRRPVAGHTECDAHQPPERAVGEEEANGGPLFEQLATRLHAEGVEHRLTDGADSGHLQQTYSHFYTFKEEKEEFWVTKKINCKKWLKNFEQILIFSISIKYFAFFGKKKT